MAAGAGLDWAGLQSHPGPAAPPGLAKECLEWRPRRRRDRSFPEHSLSSRLVCAMKRKAPDAREEACVLCRRADSDQDKYGEKRRKDGLCAHENCLAGGRPWDPEQVSDGGLLCSFQLCYICGERGATIRCRQKGCKRSFHFPCGCEDGCVSQFFGQYRSFCREHCPAQTVQAHRDGETSCLICLEPVEEQLSYHALVCPACRHAWFHRGCIQVEALPAPLGHGRWLAVGSAPLTLLVPLLQQQALRAGFFCFQCPQCKDRETFLWEMSSMGIRVPVREAAWEADGAFDQLYERHSRCDASRCLYTRGREEAEDEGPWHLLLCCSCAAKGTHRRCSALRATADTWECDDCAGLGTCKRRTWVPNGSLRAKSRARARASLQHTVGDDQLQHQQPSGLDPQLPGSCEQQPPRPDQATPQAGPLATTTPLTDVCHRPSSVGLQLPGSCEQQPPRPC
ncbi:PHD finger protein 7-like [Rhea pennata]|uniref:PHD finger protein 7-like n=1 Tax=Rhea pennata TaxID=8795 RepID=UPI002E26C89E